MSLTRAPEVENGLLKCDLRGRDQDEEADPVKGAKVQVLCAGVCYGTHVGQQLSGHCQLDRPDLTPLYEVFCTHKSTDSYHRRHCPGLNCAHSLVKG